MFGCVGEVYKGRNVEELGLHGGDYNTPRGFVQLA